MFPTLIYTVYNVVLCYAVGSRLCSKKIKIYVLKGLLEFTHEEGIETQHLFNKTLIEKGPCGPDLIFIQGVL